MTIFGGCESRTGQAGKQAPVQGRDKPMACRSTASRGPHYRGSGPTDRLAGPVGPSSVPGGTSPLIPDPATDKERGWDPVR